jgi:hypothetical protein
MKKQPWHIKCAVFFGAKYALWKEKRKRVMRRNNIAFKEQKH